MGVEGSVDVMSAAGLGFQGVADGSFLGQSNNILPNTVWTAKNGASVSVSPQPQASSTVLFSVITGTPEQIQAGFHGLIISQ